MSFEYKRKINYYETDMMGIVHHSNYVRFLEEARCALLEHIECPMAFLEANGITSPILEVNIKYKHHVTSGDTITIKPIMEDFGGVRFTFRYEVTDDKTGETVIEAITKHCFTTTDLRPVSLKKANPEIYEKIININE